MDADAIIDQDYLIKDGDWAGISDISRTTANSTSGLGTERAQSASAPTYSFNIGAGGNGAGALAAGSTMREFIIIDELMNLYELRGMDAYFGSYFTRGRGTVRVGLITLESISSQYILSGTYIKNAQELKLYF